MTQDFSREDVVDQILDINKIQGTLLDEQGFAREDVEAAVDKYYELRDEGEAPNLTNLEDIVFEIDTEYKYWP